MKQELPKLGFENWKKITSFDVTKQESCEKGFKYMEEIDLKENGIVPVLRVKKLMLSLILL